MRNDVQARSAVSQENLQENFAVVTAQNLEIEKIHTVSFENIHNCNSYYTFSCFRKI